MHLPIRRFKMPNVKCHVISHLVPFNGASMLICVSHAYPICHPGWGTATDTLPTLRYDKFWLAPRESFFVFPSLYPCLSLSILLSVRFKKPSWNNCDKFASAHAAKLMHWILLQARIPVLWIGKNLLDFNPSVNRKKTTIHTIPSTSRWKGHRQCVGQFPAALRNQSAGRQAAGWRHAKVSSHMHICTIDPI